MQPRDLIDGRYELLDRLGSGAMGEVWKARQIKFKLEDRFVAIKFLREDDSLRADRDARGRLARALQQEGAQVPVQTVIGLLDEALDCGQAAAAILAERVAARAAGRTELPGDDVLALFDELVTDPTCCQNARERQQLRELFEVEANALVNLRHENIVTTFDTGHHEDVPYLAMDFVDGQTLDRLILRGTPMSRRRQLELMEDLCSGLAYAHGKGLVHRDIKPANLMIENRAAGESQSRLRILDFGVAKKRKSDGETVAGAARGIIGTLNYMSPEQIRAGAVDRRSDIFAVGAVFYELLTGQKAFPGGRSEQFDITRRIVSEPPRPIRELVSDLEPDIEVILNRALEKSPDQRYQDLSDMRRDLERARRALDAASTVVLDNERILRQAERALRSGDDRGVLDAVGRVLSIEPENAAAIALRDQALALQLEKRVAQSLSRARQALAEEGLTEARIAWEGARTLAPESADVRAVGSDLEAAEARREEQLRWDAALAALLARAADALATGDAIAAAAALAEVEALAPRNARGIELKADLDRLREKQAAEARAAQQRAIDAQLAIVEDLLGSDRLDEADSAIGQLASLGADATVVGGVRARLTDALANRARARAAAEQARREADQLAQAAEQQRQIDAGVETVRIQLEQGTLEDAAETLKGLGRLAPDAPILQDVAREVEAARRARQAEEARLAIDAKVMETAALIDAGRLDEAGRALDELDGAGADPSAVATLRTALDRALAARAEAAKAKALADAEAAKAKALADAEAAKAKALADAKAAEDAKRLAAGVADVRTLIAGGDLQAARPALDALRKDHGNAPELRVLAEALSAAVAAAEQARRDAEASALIDRATRSFDAGDRDAALDLLRGAAASHPDIARALEALEARQRDDLRRLRREAMQARLRAAFSGRRLAVLAGVLAVVAAAAFGYRYLSTRPPATPPVPISIALQPTTTFEIVSLTGTEAPAGPQSTPSSLSLQPGRYRVTATNPGTGTPLTFEFAVEAGTPAQIVRDLPVALSVDLLPWANVTFTGENAPSGVFVTPFVVHVPPGRYRLAAENGGLTPPRSLDVTVPAGAPLAVRDLMPGFSPGAVVDQLLRPPR